MDGWMNSFGKTKAEVLFFSGFLVGFFIFLFFSFYCYHDVNDLDG